jgi:hypothetical protein
VAPGDKKIGLFSAQVLELPQLKRRIFWISTMRAYSGITLDGWRTLFHSVRLVALDLECFAVQFDSDKGRVAEIAEELGATAKTRYTLEV